MSDDIINEAKAILSEFKKQGTTVRRAELRLAAAVSDLLKIIDELRKDA